MYARHFQFNAFRNAFAPRKPRHPLLRLGIGLLGLAVLAVLVFVSVFVGAAMIAGGLLYRLLRQRGNRSPATTRWKANTGWSASRPCRCRAERTARDTVPA